MKKTNLELLHEHEAAASKIAADILTKRQRLGAAVLFPGEPDVLHAEIVKLEGKLDGERAAIEEAARLVSLDDEAVRKAAVMAARAEIAGLEKAGQDAAMVIFTAVGQIKGKVDVLYHELDRINSLGSKFGLPEGNKLQYYYELALPFFNAIQSGEFAFAHAVAFGQLGALELKNVMDQAEKAARTK